ncbi:hypothetical protein WA577_005597, partial [Blastocystis sp. JDR]
LVPVTEAVVAIVASLVAKAAAAPVLAQFYDAACVRQLLCCVQRSMFPLGPQLRALLLQNDEDFYAAYQASCLRKAVCRLFETLARQFGEPTLQYLQGEYRSVAQLGEQELFGFLCMLERGCGYVAKGLS